MQPHSTADLLDQALDEGVLRRIRDVGGERARSTGRLYLLAQKNRLQVRASWRWCLPGPATILPRFIGLRKRRMGKRLSRRPAREAPSRPISVSWDQELFLNNAGFGENPSRPASAGKSVHSIRDVSADAPARHLGQRID